MITCSLHLQVAEFIVSCQRSEYMLDMGKTLGLVSFFTPGQNHRLQEISRLQYDPGKFIIAHPFYCTESQSHM